eukprot:2746304-Rhodomonas_salina.6
MTGTKKAIGLRACATRCPALSRLSAYARAMRCPVLRKLSAYARAVSVTEILDSTHHYTLSQYRTAHTQRAGHSYLSTGHHVGRYEHTRYTTTRYRGTGHRVGQYITIRVGATDCCESSIRDVSTGKAGLRESAGRSLCERGSGRGSEGCESERECVCVCEAASGRARGRKREKLRRERETRSCTRGRGKSRGTTPLPAGPPHALPPPLALVSPASINGRAACANESIGAMNGRMPAQVAGGGSP